MRSLVRLRGLVVCLLAACVVAACSATPDDSDAASTAGEDMPEAEPVPDQPPADLPAPPPADPEPPATADGIPARPTWLGTRVLPLRPDGLGQTQPTPPELDDRRLPPSPPPPALPPPPADGTYASTVDVLPDAVAARSTWSPDCPVAREDLRYLTVTFWGFDEQAHTGELLVHERVADAMADVFRRLYEARFPIEEMRVITLPELDAPPTGDGNTTTAFVCRPTVTSTSWSQHAYGLAVDINPFHNPYTKGDIVVPELASSYLDRDRHRPGMIQPGDVVTDAFAQLGWGWGGNWSSAKDWMHFSHNGR